ncbi:MAG: polysaccharide biosynthesis protein [Nodosilinea sp.]
MLRYSNVQIFKLGLEGIWITALTMILLDGVIPGTWPISLLFINAFIVVHFIFLWRLLARRLIISSIQQKGREKYSKELIKRVVIYGAGAAGSQLLHSLINHPLYQIVGLIDDDERTHGLTIEGYKIYTFNHLITLWSQKEFDLVVLAMPSVSKSIKKTIIQRLQALNIPVQTVPSITSLLSGQAQINELRKVNISELLGRVEVAPRVDLLLKQIQNRVILVTGAGGSIGSEICRQIMEYQPRSLVLYELNEFLLYQIHQELSEAYPSIDCYPCLGNVGDTAYLTSVLKAHRVEVVYHTAAYKHVPLLENNVVKAVENNILGSLSAAHGAIAAAVKEFVLISTDKAVRPTNIMGTTKRVTELIVQALAADPKTSTRFAIVRFGNVLGSSGSVIPRFQDQIARGGPITLTHPEITRYFMSIPEAARLVIQASQMATGGEVFLLDMGEPVKIYDLAVQMIYLNGLQPGKDIDIEVTGLRPGEKLYEELLIAGDQVKPTLHPQIYCSHEYFIPWPELEAALANLKGYVDCQDISALKRLLKGLVPEYKIPDHQRSLRVVRPSVNPETA